MEEKKKHRGRRIAVPIIICVLLAAMCAGGIYLYRRASSGLFFEDTVINGEHVDDMSCSQVMSMLSREYSAPVLTVSEEGEEAMTLTLGDMGYTVNEAVLLEEVEDCMRDQNHNLIVSLYRGNTYEVDIPFKFDEAVFEENVTSASFANGRQPSENAKLKYSKKNKEYYIKPEVYGNVIDDADLQVMVKDYADKLVEKDRPQPDGTIDLPDSFYFLPEITEDDEELNTLMNLYNSFCKATITLTFGEEEVLLDWDDLQDWLIVDVDTGTAEVDEQKAEDFVYNLAYTYDTLYMTRDFVTSSGTTISFDSGDYGYQIDQEGELTQLLEDIYSNTEVTRDPVYSNEGVHRNGVDDICGTYVEVSLTDQHLWYYKNGELIVSTDVVTGMPTAERETITGLFTIPYKEMNVTLRGGTGGSAWSTPVTYWMPFYEGQGLHDATWRGSFGGSIYLSNGSHGCVNMPYSAAQTTYESMEERTPIFLYK